MIVRFIFSSLQFEYSGVGGKPTGFKYDDAKDTIRWNNLKPRDYMPLIKSMFREFINKLPPSK